MLAEIRCRDEDFRERHRIIRKEEHLEVVLGVGVLIDHARDVDDELDRLQKKRTHSSEFRSY